MKVKKSLICWLLVCSIIATYFVQGSILSNAATGTGSVNSSGDLNGDGVINMADVMILASAFNSAKGDLRYNASYDLNNDSAINMTDVMIVAGDFNKKVSVPTPTSTKAPTPTPTSKPSGTPVQIKVGISGMNMDTSQIKTKYMDVPYATTSKTQTCDIFLPSGISGPYPVIVAIHGGAYIGGSSKGSDNAPMVEGGVNRGYAVVSINYRLAQEAKFPAAVNDCKAAIRFIRANAAKYNLKTDNIAAWGSSAGGYFVAMLGTTGNVTTLDGDVKDNISYSSAVQAVVDWFGPTDFLKMDDQFKESGVQNMLGHNGANSPESQFIGKQITLDPATCQKANPETYISTMDISKAPSFYIQHGSNDTLVPYQQSKNLAAKLKPVLGDSKVYFELIQGAGHGTQEFSAANNVKKVFTFLDGILK